MRAMVARVAANGKPRGPVAGGGVPTYILGHEDRARRDRESASGLWVFAPSTRPCDPGWPAPVH